MPELDIASVPKGYLGEPLFQHPFVAEIRGSDSLLGSDSNFIQVHMQPSASSAWPASGTCCCAMRSARALVSRFIELPTIYRFFAGGDNSVRGFAYNELSPTDPVCAPQTARREPAQRRRLLQGRHPRGLHQGGRQGRHRPAPWR